MSKPSFRLFGTVGTVLALGATLMAPSASAAVNDPIAIFQPHHPVTPMEPNWAPPNGYFEGPCGIGVAPNGDYYVADYYSDAVNLYSLTGVSQIGDVEPNNGPCGLAVSESGVVYVNNFHQNVINLNTRTPLAAPTEDPAHHRATGVAIEAVTNRVYVNNRTYITVFKPNGEQVMEGLEPLKIGLNAAADYYGLAISSSGLIYVADAKAKKVKVFNTGVSLTTPVAQINGPGGGFNSLRDASLAIDRGSGSIYVTDNLQPTLTEEPEATVDVFNSANVYVGALKYRVYDALPVGLAVDNTGGSNQGRVYVTSGNTDQAAIYIYGPNSQTIGTVLPPSAGAVVKFNGSGGGHVSSATGEISCSSSCDSEILSGRSLTLEADPSPGSAFSGWSGDCQGEGPSCTILVDEATTVGASFTDLSPTSGHEAQKEGQARPLSGGPVQPSSASLARKKHPHHKHRRHHRRHRADAHKRR